MKDQIRYFIAGIFIGISELLPGISGATVALMFGVYERILAFLTQLKGFNLIIPLLICLLYTSPSPRDGLLSRMPSSA